MYLLDTNVVSELRKPERSPHVVRWIENVPTCALKMYVVPDVVPTVIVADARPLASSVVDVGVMLAPAGAVNVTVCPIPAAGSPSVATNSTMTGTGRTDPGGPAWPAP